MAPRMRAYFAGVSPPDWSDRAAVIEYLVDFHRALAAAPIDEAAVREMYVRMIGRGSDAEANVTNHDHVEHGEGWRSRLGAVRAPTLVIHGERDPLFPLEHGRALAREIPGATLLIVPDLGHEPPPRSTWDTVVPAILGLASGSWEQQADRLAAASLAAGDPTGWFEPLYAGAVAGQMPLPWDGAPRRQLVDWAGRQARVNGKKAVIVGAGLGENAELVAGLGYDTLAFDIAPTAVTQARQRFPRSVVDYRVGDLLDLPPEWLEAFDLVVEVYTVQALPVAMRADATRAVTRLVAPGGTLLVIAVANVTGEPVDGPPWPLRRSEVEAFAADGFAVVGDELLTDDGVPRWRMQLRRSPMPLA